MRFVFEYGLWETEFFLNDLLPQGKVSYVRTENLCKISEPCDVLAFACRLHKFSEIIPVIKRIKPRVVIMTSDEFRQEKLFEYNAVGNECELFLRQYHHPGSCYTSNTLHLPLGYTNGCRVFQERKTLKWSWFGQIKKDRLEMINEFKKLDPYLIGTSLPSELMCKSYSQSIFVPCGRGNSSLDCYRLYEASMNGAVPVVVGSKEEIEYTFRYEGNPPWLFSNSWKEAADICFYHREQEGWGKRVSDWWQSRISKVKDKIHQTLR